MTNKANNPVLSIACVADVGLFAEHIFPLVLEPKDKRNCMLVCKQWYSQMRTSSAWQHIRTVKVWYNYGRKHYGELLRIRGDTWDEVQLRIMREPNETAVVPDQYVLSLLQLCTNIRTVEWGYCRLLCDGVDTLIGWLNEGKLLWPKLSFIEWIFHLVDLPDNVAKCDYLLSTTFNRVRRIGVTFDVQDDEQKSTKQQQEHERDCANAVVTLLSHHVHKLHKLWLLTPFRSEYVLNVHTTLLSSVLHAQPTALSVLKLHVYSAEDIQMLIELTKLQRGGTLTELDVRDFGDNDDDTIDWCALLNAIDRCAVQNLQRLQCAVSDSNKLTDVCALLAEKCEKLSEIELLNNVKQLTLDEFTTIVHLFTNARKKFTFSCNASLLAIDDHYRGLVADQLATALRCQFDAQKFDGNVEITGDDKFTYNFRVNNCEFTFKPLVAVVVEHKYLYCSVIGGDAMVIINDQLRVYPFNGPSERRRLLSIKFFIAF